MSAVTPADDYKLTGVAVSAAGGLLRICAQSCGPRGSKVWVRAWLSNETETLAETALDPVAVGTRVAVEVRIPENLDPSEHYTAYIRIESSPLQTRQVVATPIAYQLLAAGRL